MESILGETLVQIHYFILVFSHILFPPFRNAFLAPAKTQHSC
jgi:hypothetical protein